LKIFYRSYVFHRVLKFKIDTSKFLDLRSLGTENVDLKTMQTKFYKLTKITLPYECKNYYGYRCNTYEFWSIIRQDAKGLIKNRILAKGYNGFIMNEFRTMNNQNMIHTVYVLLNNEPIIA